MILITLQSKSIRAHNYLCSIPTWFSKNIWVIFLIRYYLLEWVVFKSELRSSMAERLVKYVYCIDSKISLPIDAKQLGFQADIQAYLLVEHLQTIQDPWTLPNPGKILLPPHWTRKWTRKWTLLTRKWTLQPKQRFGLDWWWDRVAMRFEGYL